MPGVLNKVEVIYVNTDKVSNFHLKVCVGKVGY